MPLIKRSNAVVSSLVERKTFEGGRRGEGTREDFQTNFHKAKSYSRQGHKPELRHSRIDDDFVVLEVQLHSPLPKSLGTDDHML
jgi:hypothetical protein